MNRPLLWTGEIQFYIEPFEAVYAEAGFLFDLHYQEIAKNKQLLKLSPDIEMYRKADKEGKLLVITARTPDKLVGYYMWVMVQHPHYSDVTIAEEDLHFLLPECRRGLAGYQFLKFAREVAIAYGAKFLLAREKIGHEHPALMQRLGFVPTDITYTYVVK